jgi:hypothetical protein
MHTAVLYSAQGASPIRLRREGLDELWPVATHSTDPDRYRSYLVRLWREAPGAPWRCQVQCVGTERERRFAGLAELFEFLVTDAAGGSEGADRNSGTLDMAQEGG